MLKTILNTTTKRVVLVLLLIVAVASCKKEDGPQIGLTPNDIEGNSWECTRKVYVTSNFTEWSITKPDSATWLSINPMSGSSSTSYEVTLQFAENPDTTKRSTVIFVSSKVNPSLVDSLTVYQEGQKLEILFNPTDSIFDSKAATHSFEIESNLPWVLDSSSEWISVAEVDIADSSSDKNNFSKRKIEVALEENSSLGARSGEIIFKNSNPNSSEWRYTHYITQTGTGTLESDTEALKELYSSLSGDAWTTKWDLSAPVESWEGITLEEHYGQMRVSEVVLDNNNLSGELPENLGDLSYLKKLTLSGNSISGEVPQSICELDKLMFLSLNENELSGELPAELGDMTSMVRMHLNDNQLSGSIPSSIANMSRAEVLTFNNNLFTGDFPTGVEKLAYLQYFFVENNYLTGNRPSAYEKNKYWLQWVFTPQL